MALDVIVKERTVEDK